MDHSNILLNQKFYQVKASDLEFLMNPKYGPHILPFTSPVLHFISHKDGTQKGEKKLKIEAQDGNNNRDDDNEKATPPPEKYQLFSQDAEN